MPQPVDTDDTEIDVGTPCRVHRIGDRVYIAFPRDGAGHRPLVVALDGAIADDLWRKLRCVLE